MSPAARVIEQMTQDHTADSRYAWIIDTDHLFLYDADTDGALAADNEAGITGPSNAPAELLMRLAHGDGVTFRMYDDDDILYYSGRIIALNVDGTEQTFSDAGEEFFGPLWDFGTPNAGASSIRYMHKRVWTTL